MPKFLEDVSLQGTQLADAVLQNNAGDLNTFRQLGRMYWDTRNAPSTWSTPAVIPGYGPAAVANQLIYPNVGRIRYWAQTRDPATGNVETPDQYASVATLWDLDRLAQWAGDMVGGSGITVAGYSIWGNKQATANGGEPITLVQTGTPILQIPVGFFSVPDATDTRTINFKKAFFYGKLTGNGSNKTFTFTHNMNTRDLLARVREVTSNRVVDVDITFPTMSTMVVHFDAVPANLAVFYVLAIGVADMDPATLALDSYYVAAVASA